MPMNPVAKEAWLEWLRDPKHKQAKQKLRDGDGFCCLGGLCEVYMALEGDGKWEDEVFLAGEDYHSTELPDPVTAWAGLPDDIGSLPQPITIPDQIGADGDTIKIENLIYLNDDADYSFAQIADVIEEQF